MYKFIFVRIKLCQKQKNTMTWWWRISRKVNLTEKTSYLLKWLDSSNCTKFQQIANLQ